MRLNEHQRRWQSAALSILPNPPRVPCHPWLPNDYVLLELRERTGCVSTNSVRFGTGKAATVADPYGLILFVLAAWFGSGVAEGCGADA